MIRRFAGFEVDLEQHIVRRHGVRVGLQRKPFQILALLLRQPGALVTREEIIAHLWPDSRVSCERSLNTAMNVLRQALGESSPDYRYVETRPGLGYCFIAPVEQVPEGKVAKAADVPRDCLKGRYFLDKMTEEDTRKASGHFEAALLEQPCLTAAYAGLTDVWCEFARLSMVPAGMAAAKAREFATLALNHDPDASPGYLSMARVHMLFDWDWQRAEVKFVRAIELDARSAEAHAHYASLLVVMDENEKALEQIAMAAAIEPLSLPIGLRHAWILYAGSRFEEAATQCWRVLALEPRFWPAQLALGMTYHQLGMSSEAHDELQNAAVCSYRNPVALAALGGFGGVDVLNELQQLATRRHVNPLSFALAYAGLKRDAQAQEWFDRANLERDPNVLWLVVNMGGKHRL